MFGKNYKENKGAIMFKTIICVFVCMPSFGDVSLRRDQLNRCKQKYAKKDNYSHLIQLSTPQISSGTWEEKEQTDPRKTCDFLFSRLLVVARLCF